MIFAIGAGDQLIGVTTYCNYPEEAKAKEKIGDTQTPNIEKIIALKPEVVFVSKASQLEAFTKTLESQAIAVYVTDPTTLGGVFTNLMQLGDLFGRKQSAINLVNGMTDRVNAVRRNINDADAKPRVFIQISSEPLFTIGKDSFLTELVEQAGGVSVTKEVATAYPMLSAEAAAASNPDVIFLSDSEDNREPNKAFRDSRAVKAGRVYRINADIISRPGPRLVDAMEHLARKLRELKANS